MSIFNHSRILTAYSTPHHQRYGSDQAAYRIRDKIRPPSLSTRKIQLMPLIKQTDQQRAGKCNDQPAPSVESAREAKRPGEQRENNDVKQFIPWCGYQIYSNRLRSPEEQANHDPECQQHGCDTKVTGLHIL